MFPRNISLMPIVKLDEAKFFFSVWSKTMGKNCYDHPVWQSEFVKALKNPEISEKERFNLAATWSVNMIHGSFMFPAYVAGLAARAEQDAVRHCLLENAWDESGSHGHSSRSHFWLAVKLMRLLGITDKEIGRLKPLPEAIAYTEEHHSQCLTGEYGFALGMLCLIEEFTGPEFSMILKAFHSSSKKGMNADPAEFVLKGGAEYFTANITDDERHRVEMPLAVATWLSAQGVDIQDADETRERLDPVINGIIHSADMRLRFFDGIYSFVKKGGTFRNLVAQ